MTDAAPAPAPPLAATTRERLVQATTELLEEGGFAAASVATIAARTGVATGTLYRHFPSKAELFVEVFRSVCGRELVAMRKSLESEQTATQRLDAVVDTFATRALRNPRLAWALVAEPVDPLVDAERLSFRRTYREHLAKLLVSGIETGEFPAQDATLSAAAIVGAIGDALVGPLSPIGETATAGVVDSLQVFCRRAVGAAA